MRLKHGDVLDVEEYHDGNYGGKGKTRQKKEKLNVMMKTSSM